MEELWFGIQPLVSDLSFYLRVLGAVALWYVLAYAIAHLTFGGGREAVSAAVLGSWLSMVVVTAAAAFAGYYLWASLSMAVALGVLVFVVLLLLSFALTRGARAD